MVNMSKNKIIGREQINSWILKRLYIILLAFFVIISLVYINSYTKKQISYVRSSQLKKVTVNNNMTSRTDYIDDKGEIRIAADLGYATVIITRTDNGQLEQYYDDKGIPIRRNNGYYSVFREYDDNGNNIRNTYLDPDGNPAKTTNGYAIEKKEYDDNNRLIVLRYYDVDGKPVESPYFGYGRLNEYDEHGRNIKTTYIDASGEPLIISQGFASVVRLFYETDGFENGKEEAEFYFDEEGFPIALSLGQYGVHKEYDTNGQEAVLTYLDKDGFPIVTSKGYTTVKRTYKANNSIATELYFDLNGDPVSISEGQYGIKREDGKTIFLNQNGDVAFNIRTLLYNNTWIVIPFTLAVIIMSAFFDRKWNMIFLILYIWIIVYFTLMFRDNIEAKRTEILWYYRRVFIDIEARTDILRNIWLFIPFGAILYQLYPRKIILFIPIVVSICIEGIQFKFGIGFYELDDVISNGLGGTIGFFVGKMTTEQIQRIKSWRHIYTLKRR